MSRSSGILLVSFVTVKIIAEDKQARDRRPL
jgi:hypothetical protein